MIILLITNFELFIKIGELWLLLIRVGLVELLVKQLRHAAIIFIWVKFAIDILLLQISHITLHSPNFFSRNFYLKISQWFREYQNLGSCYVEKAKNNIFSFHLKFSPTDTLCRTSTGSARRDRDNFYQFWTVLGFCRKIRVFFGQNSNFVENCLLTWSDVFLSHFSAKWKLRPQLSF